MATITLKSKKDERFNGGLISRNLVRRFDAYFSKDSVATSSEAKDYDYDDDDDDDDDDDAPAPAPAPTPTTFSLADAFPNRERDNGIKKAKDDDDDDATLYFCPREDGCWFAIPPQPREAKARGEFLAPVLLEPEHPGYSYVQPFTLGRYMVLIIPRPEKKNPYNQQRDVYYIDVTKTGPNNWWAKAPAFIGSKMCLFFVANYKIYGLECGKDDQISLKFLDFRSFEEEWQPTTSPNGYISPDLFSKKVAAFMLQCEEEDSNTSSQVQTDPLPLRAFFFTDDGPCIYYDFTKNALSLSEDLFSNLRAIRSDLCKGVFVGNTMYILAEAIRSYSFMAYNPRGDDANSCLTKVTGLEKGGVFPPSSLYPLPPATLLHLGKSRLCILWARVTPRRTTKIHCTKFDVNENQGKHFAENVSTEVYNVYASGDCWRLDALAYCSKTTSF